MVGILTLVIIKHPVSTPFAFMQFELSASSSLACFTHGAVTVIFRLRLPADPMQDAAMPHSLAKSSGGPVGQAHLIA